MIKYSAFPSLTAVMEFQRCTTKTGVLTAFGILHCASVPPPNPQASGEPANSGGGEAGGGERDLSPGFN